jgi:hypothetical protein
VVLQGHTVKETVPYLSVCALCGGVSFDNQSNGPGVTDDVSDVGHMVACVVFYSEISFSALDFWF